MKDWFIPTLLILLVGSPLLVLFYDAIQSMRRPTFEVSLMHAELKGYERGLRIGKESRKPAVLTKETIPQALIDIVDEAAGKLHGRDGVVVDCLVEVINAYNKYEDR